MIQYTADKEEISASFGKQIFSVPWTWDLFPFPGTLNFFTASGEGRVGVMFLISFVLRLGVYCQIDTIMRWIGANTGRNEHKMTRKATQVVTETREKFSRLLIRPEIDRALRYGILTPGSSSLSSRRRLWYLSLVLIREPGISPS